MFENLYVRHSKTEVENYFRTGQCRVSLNVPHGPTFLTETVCGALLSSLSPNSYVSRWLDFSHSVVVKDLALYVL